MKFEEHKNQNSLYYEIKADSIMFACDAIDGYKENENPVATHLIYDLLFELSEGHRVFMDAYRLPYEAEIIDPSTILARTEAISDPFHTYFHLGEAKVNAANAFWAVDSTIYFFEKSVKWVDFLASFPIERLERLELKKLIQSGKLDAYFEMYDHGSDYIFECSRAHERRLLQFFEDMAGAGYEVGTGRIMGTRLYIRKFSHGGGWTGKSETFADWEESK